MFPSLATQGNMSGNNVSSVSQALYTSVGDWRDHMPRRNEFRVESINTSDNFPKM